MAYSRSRKRKSRQAALKPRREEGQWLKLGHEQNRDDESGRKLPQGDQNTRHEDGCQENRDRPDPQIENPIESQQRNQDRRGVYRISNNAVTHSSSQAARLL